MNCIIQTKHYDERVSNDANDFVNRTAEFALLDTEAKHGGLVVVFGRRRVGKTRLLTEWLRRQKGLYSQAIEGPMALQLEQVWQDTTSGLGGSLVPKTWAEYLELVRIHAPRVLCLDEFPYLVASDPTLPSVLQRWLDHARPKKTMVILSGSSSRAMNDTFLNRAAPLYGRARRLMHVEPMSYGAFCASRGIAAKKIESFSLYSLVGGIPRYWELLDARAGLIENAERLYFGFAPYMEQEPSRLLRDERLGGAMAVAILELIGRDVHRPSEIAARLSVPQTNLSRPLQELIDASLVEREIPFGQSVRTAKHALYKLRGPSLRFWFSVYSPHRTRFARYGEAEKAELIHQHTSQVFEDHCRSLYPGASRYWDARSELDLVLEEPRGLAVFEVKYKKTSEAERKKLLDNLQERFERSALASKTARVRYELLDSRVLESTEM